MGRQNLTAFLHSTNRNFWEARVVSRKGSHDMRLIHKRISHAAYFIEEHPFDFVAHGFPAGGTEMDLHPVGGLSDFLHQCVTVKHTHTL